MLATLRYRWASGALYVGVLCGLVAAGATVAYAGPRVGLAVGLAPWLMGLAIAKPRFISLVAVPVFLLLPPTIRVPLPGVPELTPLRVLIFLAALGWCFYDSQEGAMPRRYVTLAAIFTIYVVLDAVPHGSTSVNRGLDYSLEGLLTAWIVWRSIRDKRDLLNLVDLLVGVIMIASILALAEVGTHHYLIAAHEPYFFHAPARNGSLRAQGIFPHPLVFGAALALMLPITVVRYLTAQGWRRTLAASSTVLIALALLASSGRGPWGGALVAIVLLVTLLRGSRRLAIVSAILVCAVAIGFSPEGGKVGKLASGIFNAQSGQEAGVYTIEYRQKLLSAAVAYAKHHPFGTGPGLARELELFASVGGNRTNLAESIDNAYAKYAVEIGPIGLALFLLLLGTIIGANWQARRSPDADLSMLASGILAGEIAILVTSATVATFSWAQLAAMFWIFVGVSMAIPGLVTKQGHDAPTQ